MDYQIFLGVGLRSRAAGALISYVGRRHKISDLLNIDVTWTQTKDAILSSFLS